MILKYLENKQNNGSSGDIKRRIPKTSSFLPYSPFNPSSLFLAYSTSGMPGSASFQRLRNFW
jgi:hypothetical protein